MEPADYVSSSSRDDCCVGPESVVVGNEEDREKDFSQFVNNLYSDVPASVASGKTSETLDTGTTPAIIDYTEEEIRESLLKMTENIQSKYHRDYERAMLKEHKQHQNRLELVERYIMGSKFIRVNPGTRVDYRLDVPLWGNTSEYRVTSDKDHILTFRKIFVTHEFDLRTGVITDKGGRFFFEGKRVIRGLEYQEREDAIVMTEVPKMLYRDEKGIVKNYVCETGFSFYHNGKIIPVSHTSPETRALELVSVVIGEAIPRAVSIESTADIIDDYEREMEKKRCYYVTGNIFLHRGVYYNYYVTGGRDKPKTILRHLGSGTKLSVCPGYHHFYTVGNHLVKVTNTMISVFYNHDD